MLAAHTIAGKSNWYHPPPCYPHSKFIVRVSRMQARPYHPHGQVDGHLVPFITGRKGTGADEGVVRRHEHNLVPYTCRQGQERKGGGEKEGWGAEEDEVHGWIEEDSGGCPCWVE